jgi:predicted nucleotidyltransferase
MKPSVALHLHRAGIRRIVASHRASNPRVFGSVVHGDDTEDSDLDILVDPTGDTTLFDIGAIRHELLQLLGGAGRCVDPQSIAAQISRNGIGGGSSDMSRDRQYPEFAAVHPELPLAFSYQMRNAVAHGYFQVDLGLVWKTAQDDLSNLGTLVAQVLEDLA